MRKSEKQQEKKGSEVNEETKGQNKKQWFPKGFLLDRRNGD